MAIHITKYRGIQVNFVEQINSPIVYPLIHINSQATLERS